MNHAVRLPLLSARSLLPLLALLQLASTQLPIHDDVPRLWPQPAIVESPSAFDLRLNASTFAITQRTGSDVLSWNVQYYQRELFARPIDKSLANPTLDPTALPLEELQIVIHDSNSGNSSWPSLGMDESYEIKLGSPTANLTARSVWGAIRGLETFSQLLGMNGDFVIRGNASRMRIVDRPRFAWRGLMLDPARHFLSVAEIKRQIDAMAQNKLNTLHLHLTDGESFTVSTETWGSFSNLSTFGAYHPSLAYTPADITEIVDHGRLRGVRVVPEFDMPAHMASWAQGYPQLITDCPNVNPYPQWPRYYSPADVTHPDVLAVLNETLTQVGPLFPDPFWHVGGDEPHYDCWKANANISAYMVREGIDAEGLYARFEQRYAALLRIHEKTTIGWQEIASKTGGSAGPDATQTVVEVWQGNDALASFVEKGYSAIVSSNWYLNNGGSWSKYYRDDPVSYLPANATSDQKARVLGGEACMWNSAFDAQSNMEPAIWPNAAAMAEMLWSPAVEASDDEARTRLSQHRCRMVRRGVRASPIAEDFCSAGLYVRKSRTYYYTGDFPPWPNTPGP